MIAKRRLSLSQRSKVFILSAIVLVFLVMVVPIYQIGANHELRLRIAAAEGSIRQLEDVERTLMSEISLAQSPEALIDNVVEYSLEYSEIDPSSTVVVARAV